jgi:predicted enzyme related to lactoylglutathione lyase
MRAEVLRGRRGSWTSSLDRVPQLGVFDAGRMGVFANPEGAVFCVTFAVDDADAIAARARELGGSVLAEPHNAPWVRFAVLADPAGAFLTASQFVAENR